MGTMTGQTRDEITIPEKRRISKNKTYGKRRNKML
jgi:hypothetical protein